MKERYWWIFVILCTLPVIVIIFYKNVNRKCMPEIWKDYPEFPDLYEVSNMQQVRRKVGSIENAGNKRYEGRIMTPKKDWMGYMNFGLRVDGKNKKFRKRSRMVAMTFMPMVQGKLLVNHKNGIKDDDRIENLEWCTASENIIHSHDVLGNKYGTPPTHYGKDHPKARAVLMYDFNGNFIKRYDTVAEAKKDGPQRSRVDVAARGEQPTCGGYIWKYETQN